MAKAARKAKKSTGAKRPSAAGKQRKYVRDNSGRFASIGATARGARLATATGKRRTSRALAGHAKTIEASKLKATISKPRNFLPTKSGLPQGKAKPTSKLRTRLNPNSIQPTQRFKHPGIISKNKRLRTADNRERGFMRKFGRAYGIGRNRGTDRSVKLANSERTRGRALDLYQGSKRLDGSESTIGRFPRMRTSTAFKPPSSNIKPARRFAPGAPREIILPTAKPIAKPTTSRAKPGSFRPGQLMSANAFPTNAIAKKPKIKHGYKDITSSMTRMQQQMTIARNVEIAVAQAKKEMPNLPIKVTNQRRGSTASVALNLITGARRMEINKAAEFYQIPNAYAKRTRSKGLFSSASPAHTIAHEIGHAKHRTMGDPVGQSFKTSGDRRIASRVSRYAASKSNEFVAEVRGARKVGSRFDAQIMAKYREYSGLSAKPAPRFRPTAKAKAQAAGGNPLKRNPQSKEAQADRLNVADRKQKAKALLAISKPARKAIRISLLAQRAGFAGAGVSTDGRGKGSSSSAISNIQDGRMLLMGDFGKRKNKMTPGRRQAMESTMIKSGRSLQARLRTTEIGARVKNMGGRRYTTTAKNNRNSTISKAKGLKPQNPATYGIAKTKAAKKQAFDQLSKKYSTLPDQAEQHIPGRFRGQAGKRFEASIDRAVAAVAAAKKAQFKTPAEVKATKAPVAAKPKRVRTPESLRNSRAKQVTKRRGMNIGPTAWRPDSAARMADNAARTQSRALAYLKGKRG